MAYANWTGIIMDRADCHIDETDLIRATRFSPTGLSFPYLAGGAVYSALFGTMPEDNNMETYQGLRLTDRWYSVRLVDFSTRSVPRTSIPFGSVVVGYGFESAVAETNMPVLITDWAEQGGGDYWLQMGLIEFANYGKYTIRVSALSPGNFADRSFVVDVVNPDLVLDADLALHLGGGIGGRTIGNILGALAQSKFEQRTNVFALAPVVAQGIDAIMVARGCIQYQQVDMSFTFNWAVPDDRYYLLYHYDAQRKNDIVKASTVVVW